MFKVGEHIIHPGLGVCTVVGYEDGSKPMIVLQAKSGHALTRMLYPRSQEARLHAIVSADEAEALIEGYPQMECDPFRERNSSLEEAYFKKRLKLGAPETVRVAKTMRTRIEAARKRAKKPSSYYARILKEAHRRGVEELAAAIDVDEQTIEDRIEAAISAS